MGAISSEGEDTDEDAVIRTLSDPEVRYVSGQLLMYLHLFVTNTFLFNLSMYVCMHACFYLCMYAYVHIDNGMCKHYLYIVNVNIHITTAS